MAAQRYPLRLRTPAVRNKGRLRRYVASITSANANVAAAVVTVTASVLAPAVSTGSTVTSSVVTVTASTPAASAGTNSTATPAVVTVTASSPAPAVSTGSSKTTSVVTVTASSLAPTVTTINFPYPVAVSGRKLVDQFGAQYLLRNMSVWGMAQNGSNAEITAGLEGLEAAGFKSVSVWPCGGLYNDTGSGWVRYQNKAGANFFTGTALQSSLGSAWSSMDWVMSEATRLEMTVIFAVCYTGFAGSGTSQGIGDDLRTAWTVNPTHCYDYGFNVATRYAAYPNIVWELGADWNLDSNLANAVDKVFQGIRAAEGSTHRLVVAEPDQDQTSYSRYISNEGTYPTGYEWLRVSINSVYDYDTNTVENFDAVYNEAGATSLPVWDCEIPYRGGGWAGDPSDQELRERLYSTFIRGGVGTNYGDADLWPFGLTALSAGGDSSVWTPVLTSAPTLEAGQAYAFADTYIAHASWAPTDSFITTGTGTGDTKAAAGSKGTVAVAYFPNNRTVVVDTTIITGTGNVRLRWWDPVAFSYTSIASSEAQNASRSVTIPAARGDGSRDFVLVVDQVGDATVTTSVVTVTASSVAPSVSAGSTVTTSVVGVTASTLSPSVSAGSTVATSVVGVTASTLAPGVTAGGNATATPSVVTATASVLASTASAGSTVTVGVVTVSAASVAPTVSTNTSATVTPSVVTVTASSLSPTPATGSVVASTVVTVTASALAVVQAGSPYPVTGQRVYTIRADSRTMTVRAETRRSP